jgi:cytochrome c oxidase subunit 2
MIPPTTIWTTMKRSLFVIAAIGLLPACAADAGADLDLPPAASEGRSVARSKGCAACHGADGAGGVGPPFVGLFGSEVVVQGQDEPVIADREYLVRSIVEPNAQLVEGYNLPMPRTELTDDEIDAVIAYIEALAELTP